MATSRTPPPSRSWTDKREHARLSGELAQAAGAELERRVLPLLKAMWPRAQIVAAGDGALRVDSGSGEPRRQWTQCLGFRSDQMELGLPEARDACKAIARFEALESKADVYLLIHNRDGRGEEFRKKVRERLVALVDSGRVSRAELWDRQRLLREAFNAMLRQVIETVPDQSLSMRSTDDPTLSLQAVLIRKSSLTIDQYQLKTSVEEPPEIADPAALLFGPGEHHLSLLIGEFGSGKTTAIHRSFQGGSLRPVYVAGAAISDHVRSTKDLLHSCFRSEGLFSERDHVGGRLVQPRELRLMVGLVQRQGQGCELRRQSFGGVCPIGGTAPGSRVWRRWPQAASSSGSRGVAPSEVLSPFVVSSPETSPDRAFRCRPANP